MTIITEIVEVETDITIIETASVGIQGAQGPIGPAGPKGDSGGSYVHTQNSPSNTWVVVHNLGMYPQATVMEFGGATVEGVLSHQSTNQLTITFSASISGTAYIS